MYNQFFSAIIICGETMHAAMKVPISAHFKMPAQTFTISAGYRKEWGSESSCLAILSGFCPFLSPLPSHLSLSQASLTLCLRAPPDPTRSVIPPRMCKAR